MTRPHPVTDTNQRGALNRVGNVEQRREPRMSPVEVRTKPIRVLLGLAVKVKIDARQHQRPSDHVKDGPRPLIQKWSDAVRWGR